MDAVQSFISYSFTDISLLEKALTAPGADGDKGGMDGDRDRYEGNRKLSMIGFPLRDLAVRNSEGRKDAPSGKINPSERPEISADGEQDTANHLLNSVGAQLEQRARRVGFYSHIKLNQRQRGNVNRRTVMAKYRT
jgi:hypothetical protein